MAYLTFFRILHIEKHLKGTVKGNKLKYLNKTFGDWFVLHQVKAIMLNYNFCGRCLIESQHKGDNNN